MRSFFIRRVLAIFLPVAVLATLCCGLVYAAVQQDLRMGANDPQLQLAEDAARALDGGAQPGTLVGSSKVDVAASLSPFVVIFDASGTVLATDGVLDGHDPVPPLGVLDAARTDPPNRVTWEPRTGVRVATVTVPWRGGTVMSGRSAPGGRAPGGQRPLPRGGCMAGDDRVSRGRSGRCRVDVADDAGHGAAGAVGGCAWTFASSSGSSSASWSYGASSSSCSGPCGRRAFRSGRSSAPSRTWSGCCAPSSGTLRRPSTYASRSSAARVANQPDRPHPRVRPGPRADGRCRRRRGRAEVRPTTGRGRRDAAALVGHR